MTLEEIAAEIAREVMSDPAFRDELRRACRRVTAPTPETLSLSQALIQKLRESLVTQQWSQREFAQHLGVTQSAVSYLLARKRRAMDLDYYERLARVLGLSLSELIRDLEVRVRNGRAGVVD